ncbi:MAG: hypothetical protein A2Z45_08540 [Chloroflexi bacterium RBG_19FT_COMBO_55_16]|nr:MAG: hypothetical protein A2Z45_08540 [Chloroflexi bacterium RBG_19FT_COMBO_55_16]
MSPSALFKIPRPKTRLLRVFAFDPSLNLSLDTAVINQLALSVPWEDVGLGPVGEYLEVVDVDPASNAFYPPVDLDDNYLLVQDGLWPSEGTPQFHQQMVYAVASKTIQNFEEALGRRVLWSPQIDPHGREKFNQHLRIYPHALRQANAYYSPRKKALLFGYFPASSKDSGNTLPGGIVFTCLSHDIITHETTHALLDGVHPYFGEPSNVDVLALHEAFADIVALFQHFSQPEVLRQQIARTRGDLSSSNLLAELAQQFGQATGKRGALRSAIGKDPDPTAFQTTIEPHARGSILVAAVFDAFLTVYKSRIEDLMRIATGGTGILPEGAIHPDLVNRMAEEAARVSQHILRMCIRALDYCPPVDITFGEYLRAIVTADSDLNPTDQGGYRIAMIESFRRRGIYASNVRSLSEESLLWFPPEGDDVLAKFFDSSRQEKIQKYETLQKRRQDKRESIFRTEQGFRSDIKNWILRDLSSQYLQEYRTVDMITEIIRKSLNLKLWPDDKYQSIFIDEETGRPEIKINSVRLAYRTSLSLQSLSDLVVEINQRRRGYLDLDKQAAVDAGATPPDEPDFIFRGGATMLIDINTGRVRYVISKGTDSDHRLNIQRQYLSDSETSLAYTYFGNPRLNYFKADGSQREPFALLHGSDTLEEDY